ncbi:MAG: DUF1269 domain-containing protein [Pseudomonadota bacterium]|nr:DUF1269 domain-containing protein [Pseudomonadota bacterium]
MSDLIAVSYPDENRAEEVFETLKRLQTERLLEVDDLLYVTRSKDGKVRLHQNLNTTGTGAASGAIWGGIVGMLFLVPLVGMAVGAASGAIAGKMSDYGINDKFVKDLAGQMKDGSSAVFLLVRKATPDKVLAEVGKYGGTVLRTSLSHDAETRLQAALSAAKAPA